MFEFVSVEIEIGFGELGWYGFWVDECVFELCVFGYI